MPKKEYRIIATKNILKKFTKSTGKHLCQSLFIIRDDIHMTGVKLFNFYNHLSRLSIYVQNSSTPLTLDVQFQTNQNPPSPFPSPNDNQPIKRKHNPRMTIICLRSFLQVAFVFSFNSFILSGFPLPFFHLAETSLFVF